MKKIKVFVLIIILVICALGVRKADISLRYNIGMFDYYKYNTPLTDNETKYMEKEHFLIGVYDDPPLAFINKFNNYNAGIMVDYLSQLEIELSRDIHLKVDSQEYLKKAILKNDVDVMVIENILENQKDFGISQPLCVVKGKVMVKNTSSINDIRGLSGKTLVVLESDNKDDKIKAYFKRRADIKLFEVDNIYQCFALVNNNIVDGFIGDDMEIAHYLNVTNRGSNFRLLDYTIYEKEMCLGVRKANTQLLRIINKGIIQIKKKNLVAQTQYKWLGKFDTGTYDLRQIELAYKILVAVLSIIIVFSSWNYLITQRVNTKTRELSESKEELRLIIDTMHNGLMVIEYDRIIVECNDAITGITGIKREELIGSDYHYFKDLRPFVDRGNMNRVFNLGNAYYYITSQNITSYRRMIIIEDYTEKYINEKRVRQESKMVAVGQLSAGLAHEIRNPLGLIKSYTYIIGKQSIDDMCDHALVVINDSVSRINKLIENLLRFSKLSNDETKSVNIENLLNLILELEEKNIEQNGIRLIKVLTNIEDKEIFINEDVLRMVLLNLINNSIDSFKDIERGDKEIHLSVGIEDNDLHIIVKDNGCGIEKEGLENIFNPFYSTKDNGTGLGLYIISTEISNNDGSITVDSEIDKGTEFEIILPIKDIEDIKG